MTDKSRHILFDDYSIEFTEDAEKFWEFFDKYRKVVFAGTGVINLEEIFTERERKNRKILTERYGKHYRLRLYILKGNKKIGWFFGRQTDTETFYMTNTGIFKEHRNKGIYKKMLPEILKILKKQGFQKVTSMHSVTNNNVIVPKLKAGFIITGFDIGDIFGLNLQLTYYFNNVRKKLVDYRVGMIAPDEQIGKLINPKK